MLTLGGAGKENKKLKRKKFIEPLCARNWVRHLVSSGNKQAESVLSSLSYVVVL